MEEIPSGRVTRARKRLESIDDVGTQSTPAKKGGIIVKDTDTQKKLGTPVSRRRNSATGNSTPVNTPTRLSRRLSTSSALVGTPQSSALVGAVKKEINSLGTNRSLRSQSKSPQSALMLTPKRGRPRKTEKEKSSLESINLEEESDVIILSDNEKSEDVEGKEPHLDVVIEIESENEHLESSTEIKQNSGSDKKTATLVADEKVVKIEKDTPISIVPSVKDKLPLNIERTKSPLSAVNKLNLSPKQSATMQSGIDKENEADISSATGKDAKSVLSLGIESEETKDNWLVNKSKLVVKLTRMNLTISKSPANSPIKESEPNQNLPEKSQSVKELEDNDAKTNQETGAKSAEEVSDNHGKDNADQGSVATTTRDNQDNDDTDQEYNSKYILFLKNRADSTNAADQGNVDSKTTKGLENQDNDKTSQVDEDKMAAVKNQNKNNSIRVEKENSFTTESPDVCNIEIASEGTDKNGINLHKEDDENQQTINEKLNETQENRMEPSFQNDSPYCGKNDLDVECGVSRTISFENLSENMTPKTLYPKTPKPKTNVTSVKRFSRMDRADNEDKLNLNDKGINTPKSHLLTRVISSTPMVTGETKKPVDSPKQIKDMTLSSPNPCMDKTTYSPKAIYETSSYTPNANKNISSYTELDISDNSLSSTKEMENMSLSSSIKIPENSVTAGIKEKSISSPKKTEDMSFSSPKSNKNKITSSPKAVNDSSSCTPNPAENMTFYSPRGRHEDKSLNSIKGRKDISSCLQVDIQDRSVNSPKVDKDAFLNTSNNNNVQAHSLIKENKDMPLSALNENENALKDKKTSNPPNNIDSSSCELTLSNSNISPSSDKYLRSGKSYSPQNNSVENNNSSDPSKDNSNKVSWSKSVMFKANENSKIDAFEPPKSPLQKCEADTSENGSKKRSRYESDDEEVDEEVEELADDEIPFKKHEFIHDDVEVAADYQSGDSMDEEERKEMEENECIEEGESLGSMDTREESGDDLDESDSFIDDTELNLHYSEDEEEKEDQVPDNKKKTYKRISTIDASSTDSDNQEESSTKENEPQHASPHKGSPIPCSPGKSLNYFDLLENEKLVNENKLAEGKLSQDSENFNGINEDLKCENAAQNSNHSTTKTSTSVTIETSESSNNIGEEPISQSLQMERENDVDSGDNSDEEKSNSLDKNHSTAKTITSVAIETSERSDEPISQSLQMERENDVNSGDNSDEEKSNSLDKNHSTAKTITSVNIETSESSDDSGEEYISKSLQMERENDFDSSDNSDEEKSYSLDKNQSVAGKISNEKYVNQEKATLKNTNVFKRVLSKSEILTSSMQPRVPETKTRHSMLELDRTQSITESFSEFIQSAKMKTKKQNIYTSSDSTESTDSDGNSDSDNDNKEKNTNHEDDNGSGDSPCEETEHKEISLKSYKKSNKTATEYDQVEVQIHSSDEEDLIEHIDEQSSEDYNAIDENFNSLQTSKHNAKRSPEKKQLKHKQQQQQRKVSKVYKNMSPTSKKIRKAAIEKALKTSYAIIMRKHNLMMTDAIASKCLPMNVLDAIVDHEPLKKRQKELHVKENNNNEPTKLKTSAGVFDETPLSPVRPKIIEKMRIPSGIVYVEPTTPVKKTSSGIFHESPLQKQRINVKVKRILSGQDVPPEMPADAHKGKKRKRIEEQASSLPKPQWVQSGKFEEEYLNNCLGASCSSSALDFKITATNRNNIPRVKSHELLKIKKRAEAYNRY